MKPLVVLVMSGALMVATSRSALGGQLNAPPFHIGETLEYDVSWLGISAGTVVIKVTGLESISGQAAYRVKVVAETSKVFTNFFKVRDEMISLFSKNELHSLLYRKKVREGRYRADAEIIYNQSEGFGVYKGKRFDIPLGVRDPICSLYYIRTLNLTDLAEIKMQATADNKTYPITVKNSGTELITIAGKEYKSIRIEPQPSLDNRLFQKNSSELTIWFSDDQRRIPLQILAKIKVGAIRGVLKGF